MRLCKLALTGLALLALTSQAEDFFNRSQSVSLVVDNKAHAVGDVLTVIIVESTRAASEAGTDSESSFDASVSAYDSANGIGAGAGYGRDGSDVARTSRKGTFTGQVAVRVMEVDEAGTMKVAGSQTLIINGEQQIVNVEGFVRQIDLDAANQVLSSRLSNSRIELTGDGVVADGQSPNIFSRALSWIGL